jgi:DNA-binding beta-propeller fold protein YncE
MCVCGFCALVATLAVAASAEALTQRGHTVGLAFGQRGTQAGQMVRPAGVAVNEATGDVYVVDAGNNRIERFTAGGEFLAAWGWGVSDGEAEYEVCTGGCKAGLAGEGAAQLDGASAVAVDNSTTAEDPSQGDVYVVTDTATQDNVIEKFTASGEPLGVLEMPSAESGALGGVAVDAQGGVWVSDLGTLEVIGFNNAQPNVPSGVTVRLALECEVPGFAVDDGGDTFYVAHQLPSVVGECPLASAPALVAKVDSEGRVLSEELDGEDASGIAVDQASDAATPLGEAALGDVYVDNETSVAAFDASGSLIQRFGTEGQLSSGTGIAVDSRTGAVDVADAKGDRVDVFVPEAAGAPTVDAVTFQDISPASTRLEAAIDPHGADTHYYFQYGTVDCRATPAACTDLPAAPGEDIGQGFGSRNVSAMAEGLTPGTRYFYRAVAVNADGEAEGAQTFGSFTTPASAGDALADGRAWELVSPAEMDGALIYPIGGTTENGGPASGVIEAAQDGGSITYAANAPIGEGVVANRSLEAAQVISTRAPTGWTTRDIETPNETAKGLQPGAAQEYQAFSPDLSLALVQPFGPYQLTGSHLQEPPLVPGMESEERGLYVRHDATCQSEPADCYEPLVTPGADTAGSQFGGELEFAGASPDLGHVVLSSGVPLTAALPSAPGLYEWGAEMPPAEALQLVSVLPGNRKAALEPQLGDLAPHQAAARGAVSADGSRVFWSANVEEHGQVLSRLFMRDTKTGTTIRINAPQAVKEPKAEIAAFEEVHFRIASVDGSRAFFTDTFPLTAESHLRAVSEGPADLYVCEIVEGSEGPACTLKDLTVDPAWNFGESAEVVGNVLGISEDGSYVYFVANGVLSAEAQAQGAAAGRCVARATAQAEPGATCNLYLAHYDAEDAEWEAPRFIARLSQEDQPDWGSGSPSLSRLTARVSPNGRYLAFMSKEPLTGYDNVEASETGSGARDEEVYLYDAEEQQLVCASCNPSGAEPHGVFDREASGEGKGLLVDRLGAWKESEREEQGGAGGRDAIDHWLAGSIPGWTAIEESTAFYQSRYLSNEGRLFFDSSDELVPAAKNGKEDVYEYEPEGLGSCHSSPGCVALISGGESNHESAFLDASEDGDDVFFLTNQPLVSSDQETSFDVYDARVCSASSPCLSPPAESAPLCESLETCRPADTSVSTLPGAAGSAAFSGPENVSGAATLGFSAGKPPSKPPTRAQLLARALKTCRAKFRGRPRKRAVCEREARARYGPRKPTRKSKQPGKRRK